MSLTPANVRNLDRLARAAGQTAGIVPVIDEDPHKPSALPTADSWEFFNGWSKKSNWKNEVTIKSCVFSLPPATLKEHGLTRFRF